MYGSFSADGREFVIDKPDTPRPWINYLCNRTGSYVLLLSANAGGYSFVDCPKDGRITRWRYNSLPDDRPGHYIYLRSVADGDVWTLSWQPTGKDLEDYHVTHGLGYTTFRCTYHEVDAEATYFVPLDDDIEIWRISLKNRSDAPQELEVYPFAEMCLGHALIDLVNKPNDQHFNRIWFNSEKNALFSTKTYWVTGTSANIQENKAWNKVALMKSSLPVQGYAGEREVFFGKYRNERNPLAIETGELQSTPVSSGNLVSGLKNSLTLAPNETVSFYVLLGAVDKFEGKNVDEGIESFQLCNWEKNADTVLAKYDSMDAVNRALEAVKTYWQDYTGNVQVNTPSNHMNLYLNAWNQYQGKVTFINSRNASYYHWGVTRGTGFRDSLQDIISVVIPEPDLVRRRILQIAHFQRSDGTCMHCFHPVSGEGEFTGHKDDPLWLITAVWYYLAETGDYSILNEPLPFHDGQQAVLMDHLMASVNFIETNLGPNKIPTFGKGDWNDTLDFVGGEDGMGESIWAGMFYAYNLRLLKEILTEIEPGSERVQSIVDKHISVKAALNKHAWDGEWYIRAVCSNGKILGSKNCLEGQIYLNPQSWAVLAGVAEGERAETVITAVRKHLDTDFGPKLLAPAYHEIDPRIGLMTRCVWGKKENGSIFNHTTTWNIMAECILKNGRRALELYEKIAPASFDQERYQIEPYVYCQYTTSDEHETFGQGSHSWLTGTAAWMFRSALDYILGIRPTLRGLVIDPCISPEWKNFSVTRRYRGTTYNIEIHNPDQISNGIARIVVNGESVPVDQPLPEDPGKPVTVTVTMG